MTPAEAANKVLETQKYEQVICVKDFDAQHYVVEALPQKNKLACGMQTTFGVDKQTGQVTAFMMNYGNNLDAYLSAKTVNWD